jgi:single-strand DNA-binding protein
MAGLNQCNFIGNLTRDAETRTVGEAEVAKYAIAVNGRKDKVMYIDCDHWRAGGVIPFLTKGTPVFVTGEIELQSWEKDGQTKSKLVLNVRTLQLLGGGKRREESEVEEFAGDFR